MTSIGALAIISLIAGLVIGTVALVITIVVMLRSKKYLVPTLIYSMCLLISLGLIGVFVFAWVAAEPVVTNLNTNNGYTNANGTVSSNGNANENSNPVIDERSNTNDNVNSNEIAPIEVEPTEEDYDLLAQDGKIYNEDYSFLLTVGQEHVANITEVYMVPYDGVSATYVYCYNTSDVDYASIDCPGTAVELFRVNVYTLSEWEAVTDSPFVGTKMMETAEHVYELTHPNGLLPADVPASDAFYNSVSASFNFAG